ncbi:MAG: tRNA 4-thiouridine(8) synthase ThiI [Candidatus Poribacteria bacterium]|nr:tRNA 4-thiouridine(8) synthase ThiI [Candidatus Poribacteria bacterium]
MEELFSVHYAEVGLKGKNRIFFEKRLVSNIKIALRGTGYAKVERLHDRILVRLEKNADVAQIKKRLQQVMGIAYFELACATERDMTAIKETALQQIQGRTYKSLKVETRRTDKTFPLTSPQISAEVGGHLIEKTGAKADMHNPDLICWIKITQKNAYISTEKIQGIGGLPVGVSGKVLVMLSGGIDSPVAAWQMIKRGAKAVFIHFYSYPYTDKASLEKVIELAQILAVSNYRSLVYLVPFAELQQTIVTQTPAPFRVLLYRRMMTRIAERVATLVNAEALVTGESLAQVASQTLTNLRTIEAIADIPILRPLIGEDKAEIIEKAQQIGTFDISTRPHQDCCSLFVPKHPATRASLAELADVESNLDIDALVETALNNLEKIEVSNEEASPRHNH